MKSTIKSLEKMASRKLTKKWNEYHWRHTMTLLVRARDLQTDLKELRKLCPSK